MLYNIMFIVSAFLGLPIFDLFQIVAPGIVAGDLWWERCAECGEGLGAGDSGDFPGRLVCLCVAF